MTHIPRPLQDIRAKRAQLAEQLRLIDSEVQDLHDLGIHHGVNIDWLRAERVRIAAKLAEYVVADQILTDHQRAEDANRRALWEDEAGDYTPCTEERAS